MSIIYNRYLNNVDHTWYDSSNVLYSECFDNQNISKNVKLVFKGGRTYLYKDVNADDYLQFKLTNESHGSAANKFIIKKYDCVRLSDTDMETLEKFKETTIKEDAKIDESMSNIAYHLNINDETGEFSLSVNNRQLYSGIEGQVSIINLLNSLNIKYTISQDNNIQTHIENEQN